MEKNYQRGLFRENFPMSIVILPLETTQLNTRLIGTDIKYERILPKKNEVTLMWTPGGNTRVDELGKFRRHN